MCAGEESRRFNVAMETHQETQSRLGESPLPTVDLPSTEHGEAGTWFDVGTPFTPQLQKLYTSLVLMK